VLVNVRKFLTNKFAKSRVVVVYTAALFFQIYSHLFVTPFINHIIRGYRLRVLIFSKCLLVNILFVYNVNFYLSY